MLLKKCLPLLVLGGITILPAYAMDEAELGEKMLEVARMQPGAETNSDGVTLPLYPSHEVMVHYTDPTVIPSMDGGTLGEDALPTILMKSPDSVGEVISFYEGQLDGFTRYESSEDNVTFGKGLPDDLDPLDFAQWMNTVPYNEHVSIFSQSGETMIEISYQPE